MSDTSTVTVHPTLDTIPRMPQEQLQALAESIRLHGLRQKIVRHQGVIIDGREREEACRLADVEPEYEDIEVDDPDAYILDTNLRRDHSQSQRAVVVAKVCTRRRGRPRQENPQSRGLTREQAAQRLGVSKSLVDEAIRLRKRDAELFEAVWRGDLSISAAHAQLDTEAGRAGGGKGSGKGEGSAHQPVCHMMREIVRALAREQRTREETRQLIDRLRVAAPQLQAVADTLERELPPEEAADADEDADFLTLDQLAKESGVALDRIDRLHGRGYITLPKPDADGVVRVPPDYVQRVKDANAKCEAAEAEKPKKSGKRGRKNPSTGLPALPVSG
jgi:hypothetical protein